MDNRNRSRLLPIFGVILIILVYFIVFSRNGSIENPG